MWQTFRKEGGGFAPSPPNLLGRIRLTVSDRLPFYQVEQLKLSNTEITGEQLFFLCDELKGNQGEQWKPHLS